MSNTISEYLEELVSQKSDLAANLTTMGVSASSSEKLNTLVPKVLEIEGGASDGSSAENASVFRWIYSGPTSCWGIMKKLTGDVIGQNGDNAIADISLVGDLMTVTLYGTSQSVEVLATTAIKLKAYRTGRTLGPATMTEYTMAANDQQSFTQDNVYGGIYFEAEAI